MIASKHDFAPQIVPLETANVWKNFKDAASSFKTKTLLLLALQLWQKGGNLSGTSRSQWMAQGNSAALGVHLLTLSAECCEVDVERQSPLSRFKHLGLAAAHLLHRNLEMIDGPDGKIESSCLTPSPLLCQGTWWLAMQRPR